ncbi:fatty acid--CoA ligase family protein [Streptomyces sp. NPDC088124]|uniref:class I adenylate-forming enzyme family protein n=1 Tax=Streptomyces sp. NPDC088124 TaxID=3154654 RepID=UPI00341B10C0
MRDTEPRHPVCEDGAWVDEILLGGSDGDIVLHLGGPVSRGQLRRLVAEEHARFAAAGLARGGALALRLPPSLDCVIAMLAGWRIGAQVALLDYRLTTHEVGRAIARLGPQLVVEPVGDVPGTLRGFFEISTRVTPLRGGRPARTPHALLQLSSGSTGPSKVIGRTVGDLLAEVERYSRLDGFPRRGERIVLLASIVHVLGLVGGLLYGLAAGVRIVLPTRHTADSVFRAVALDPEPTTLLGVPSQASVLAAVQSPPRLPQLVRMVTGGEILKETVRERFTTGYGAGLGAMYGMTEAGVIATDITGGTLPGLTPVPGLPVRVQDNQILLGLAASPYVGQVDPTRYVDGWLRTNDAGHLDPDTGLLTVNGRLDSQISIGGLKVDLTEVEAALCALPDVADAVVVHEAGIEAFVLVRSAVSAGSLSQALAARLAPYKRPRTLHVLSELPRTATGKPLRQVAALRAAARAGAGV